MSRHPQEPHLFAIVFDGREVGCVRAMSVPECRDYVLAERLSIEKLSASRAFQVAARLEFGIDNAKPEYADPADPPTDNNGPITFERVLGCLEIVPVGTAGIANAVANNAGFGASNELARHAGVISGRAIGAALDTSGYSGPTQQDADAAEAAAVGEAGLGLDEAAPSGPGTVAHVTV